MDTTNFNNQNSSENNQSKKYEIVFHGNGGEYFGITIVNWLLTICTLGIYYPWARAKTRKYIYSQTSFADDRFAFNGTGKEMFIGLVKLLAMLLAIYALFFFFLKLRLIVPGSLFLYFALFLITPLAIHGSFRYRMSRTTWRGIRFGYRGNKQELIVNFIKWTVLSIITLGIYSSWMMANLYKYVYGHIRFGNAECKFNGNGGTLFFINLKGVIFTFLTLGIYSFWYQRNLFNYHFENLSFSKDGQAIKFTAAATAGGFFSLLFLNGLIVIFTLGFGFAWAYVRTLKFMADNVKPEGDIDLNAIAQTEEAYTDASGDDAVDLLDIDLF